MQHKNLSQVSRLNEALGFLGDNKIQQDPARTWTWIRMMGCQTINAILSRLATLEDNNAELRGSNAELQERLAAVEMSNAELRDSNSRLEATLQTTMEAVLGVCSKIGSPNIYSDLFIS